MELNAANDSAGQDAQWAQLAPVLDDALNSLHTEDRDAIVLRYFERRDLRAIGAALGVSDDTAQKRVSRALEKLRAILTRRGITVSAVLLSSALDAGAATVPVKAALAESVSAHALSSATAVGFLASLTSALNIMNKSKVILTGLAAILAIGAAFFLLQGGATAPAPNSPAKTAAALPSKPPAPATKVETPKLPPAPAGGDAVAAKSDSASTDPKTIGILSSSKQSSATSGSSVGTLQYMSNSDMQKKIQDMEVQAADPATSQHDREVLQAYATYLRDEFPPPGANKSGLAIPDSWDALIAARQDQLDQTKKMHADMLAWGVLDANGDPAKLAHVEAMRVQYQAYDQQQQQDIDSLTSDSAGARAAFLATLQASLERAQQGIARVAKQASADPKTDPSVLAKIADEQKQFQDEQNNLTKLQAQIVP